MCISTQHLEASGGNFLHFILFQVTSCHSEVPEMTTNSLKLLLLLMLAQVQFSATVAAKGSHNDNYACNTSYVGTNTNTL